MLEESFVLEKWYVFGVVFLCVGVVLVPGVHGAMAAASEDGFYNVSVQAFGGRNPAGTAVRLTRQQYQSLQNAFVRFRARLNATITVNETVQVYREMLSELRGYGLVPKGLSQRETDRLVLGAYEHPGSPRVLVRVPSLTCDLEESRCLVTGRVQRSSSMGSLPLAVLLGSVGMLNFASWCLFMHVGYHLGQIYKTLFWLFLVLGLGSLALGITLSLISRAVPAAGFGMVSFGGFESNGYWSYPVPASGWLTTMSLNGKKNWSGEFYGNLTVSSDWRIEDTLEMFVPFPGIVGFTGLKISRLFGSDFYIGHAVKVKIGSNHSAFVTPSR